MKCANCSTEALYEYRMTANKSLFYCGKDLPKFLEPRRRAGVLTITDAMPELLASAVAALTPKVEETPVVVEKPVESAPKKRSSKKKSE